MTTSAKHTIDAVGKTADEIHEKVKELHAGLLPKLKAADHWTDKLLRFVEHSGFSVVIIGAWSIFCFVLGARLF